MSQEFLNRLLIATENRVHSDQGANCMVCLEDYNTLNTSTGIVEWEIRLPCGHRAGSSCIVTWLQSNNNCPACRAIFFPAQPRPYLEHGIMNDDRPRTVSVPARPLMRIDSLTLQFCFSFVGSDLSHTISILSRSMARHLTHLLQNHTEREIVAVCVYMASHVMRRPKTLMEISQVSRVSPDMIHSIYRQIYPDRMGFLDAPILEYIPGDHMEGMLAFLPPPDQGNRIIDDEEERRERQSRYFSPEHRLREVEEIRVPLCTELGGPSVDAISWRIAGQVALESYRGLRSPPLIVALSLYMASHLLGLQASPRRIADLVGINERSLRWAYARVYPQGNELIKPNMLPHIGLENLPRALTALPALTWPPLTL